MKTIGALIFPGFELLDLFGPLEMFGLLPEHFAIRLVGEREREVRSGQAPVARADDLFADGQNYDILLVPGGPGTRSEVSNAALLDWLGAQSERTEIVSSVCTGSALLAKAGVLDGHKATTNKKAFVWVRAQGPAVQWQARARWVEDGRFFTSSGVSAGIDMSLAVIARLHGEEQARQVATWAEYDWHSDPDWDPFAEIYGLT